MRHTDGSSFTAATAAASAAVAGSLLLPSCQEAGSPWLSGLGHSRQVAGSLVGLPPGRPAWQPDNRSLVPIFILKSKDIRQKYSSRSCTYLLFAFDLRKGRACSDEADLPWSWSAGKRLTSADGRRPEVAACWSSSASRYCSSSGLASPLPSSLHNYTIRVAT